MTLHRSDSTLSFLCDAIWPWKTKPDRTFQCQEIFQAEEEEFPDAIREFGEAGWFTRHASGSWLHYCPECGKQRQEEQKLKFQALAAELNGEG